MSKNSNKNKKSSSSSGTNKTPMIIITLALVVVLVIIFSGGKDNVAQSVEIKDGIQYVRIDAGGGYSPQTTEAKAGIPTKLIVKTNGVYDCSASLVIPDIKFKEVLAPTGEKEIDIGTKQAGETLKGLCGMGMYNFEINFI